MVLVIDAKALARRTPQAMADLRRGVCDIGFLVLENTAISADLVNSTLSMYRAFFLQSATVKALVDMAHTGSTRGWGAARAEQVNPDANPDLKEVFDCGAQLSKDDPLRLAHPEVYGENVWPENPAGFQSAVETYFAKACVVSDGVLSGVADVIGAGSDAFAGKFNPPMAMLRGNYYPARPDWAGADDFGIAPHTDYGCLTLLATDGSPGLEVQTRDGKWVGVQAAPGRFVINFGEMLESWSEGRVRATPHRVIGSGAERLSMPLFYNPSYETNVAPRGAAPVSAGEYLSRRYRETYVHLQKTA